MRLGLQRDALRGDDEALWCGPDVREGIAGDEREGRRRRLCQHADVGRLHDLRLLHPVVELRIRGPEPDHVVRPDLSEAAEERIAVRGKYTVAAAPWQRRIREMADAEQQC